MPISTLWAKSMPSIFSRKPWTKCCRACSPSVTMSMPASSWTLTASIVASRLARTSSSPCDFQGAQSMLGSASHSGFGKEPAIVVGNSMAALTAGYDCAPSCHVLTSRYRTTKVALKPATPDRKRHDRILLRLFQPLDLSRFPQYPAAGRRARRGDHLAADPGRRHLQHGQSERLRTAGDA